jgi:hypothetical protein
MNDYNFFQEDQAKLFSIFGRSKSSFHYNCLALINEQCRDNNGYIIKDSIITEIENTYGTAINSRLELTLLVDSGWIEFFQKPHLVSDFIRMTKNGRILYQAIQDIHGVRKDFSYGKYISDIYRRLITIEDTSSATYQDIIVSSVEDTKMLKEYMQNFSSSFEDFVKSQKANVKKAKEVINIMRAVSEGKEFRNYRAIVKDEFNYYKYGSNICDQIEKIKENEAIMNELIVSCCTYEGITEPESEEMVLDNLYIIKSFFMEEYKNLVEQMKETENDCYQRIANTLTLYASDGTADKSICDLIIQMIHDAQENEEDLSDEFFECFNIFDNTVFESSSLKSKRKQPEYKTEVFKERKPLSTLDRLEILLAANEKISMKASVSELSEFLEPYEKTGPLISSKDIEIKTEEDYAKVFLLLIHCANPNFKYKLKHISAESVEKGNFIIPYFEVERKEIHED